MRRVFLSTRTLMGGHLSGARGAPSGSLLVGTFRQEGILERLAPVVGARVVGAEAGGELPVGGREAVPLRIGHDRLRPADTRFHVRLLVGPELAEENGPLVLTTPLRGLIEV